MDDPLNDLPPESRREVVAAVQAALGTTAESAETVVLASEPLWDAMEQVGGLVDSWGGGEFLPPVPEDDGGGSVSRWWSGLSEPIRICRSYAQSQR